MLPIWALILLSFLGLLLLLLLAAIVGLLSLIFYKDVRTGKRFGFGPNQY